MDNPADDETATAKPTALEAIRCYGGHLNDAAYVRALLERFGTSSVVTLLEAQVRTGERSAVGAALLFTEDAIRFGLAPRSFAYAYVHSELPALIRRQVYASDFTVRHLAVHALSRLGPRENVRYLVAAFQWSLAHDPLNIDGLLMELCMVKRDGSWRTQVEAMVAAPLYVTRWAAVELLWEHGASPIFRSRPRNPAWPRQLLRTLAQDRHPLVRREAQWHLDQTRASRAKRGLPGWRRAALAERLGRGDPEPTFFELSLSVSNYLGVTGEPDYDVPLVEAIVQHLRAYPIVPGYDIDAYWQPLAAARGAPARRSLIHDRPPNQQDG